MEGDRKVRLILGAAVLFVAATLVVGLVAMGNRPLARGHVVHVDFAHVDNLQEGAEVRISALVVGRVLAVRHGASRAGNEPPPLAAARVDLWIDRGMAHLLRENSIYYVNAKGVVGERYLEVGPPPRGRAPAGQLRPGAAIRGVDSPKLDRLLQFGHDNLRAMALLARELRPEIRGLSAAMDRISVTMDRHAPPARVRRALDDLGRLVGELQDLRRELPPAPETRRTLAAVERAAQLTLDRFGPLRQRLDALELPELPQRWRDQLREGLGKLEAAATRGQAVAGLLRSLKRRVDAGQGTVGRLRADPQIIDEIKETHRILKETPWRAVVKPKRGGAGPRRR
jgi:hypothetical protein